MISAGMPSRGIRRLIKENANGKKSSASRGAVRLEEALLAGLEFLLCAIAVGSCMSSDAERRGDVVCHHAEALPSTMGTEARHRLRQAPRRTSQLAAEVCVDPISSPSASKRLWPLLKSEDKMYGRASIDRSSWRSKQARFQAVNVRRTDDAVDPDKRRSRANLAALERVPERSGTPSGRAVSAQCCAVERAVFPGEREAGDRRRRRRRTRVACGRGERQPCENGSFAC